ncbi:MAG: hypothetical protein AAGM67_21820, partial [Bacteroidota bacterium]
MKKIYRIEEAKQSRYAFRKAGMLTLYFCIGLALLFGLVLTQVKDGANFWQVVEWHWLPLIVGAMIGIRYFQELNLAKALAFEIGETYVAKYLHRETLNAANQYAVRRDERIGAKANQCLALSEINMVGINNKSIKLYTANYQSLTGNGKI